MHFIKFLTLCNLYMIIISQDLFAPQSGSIGFPKVDSVDR
jgi:hypothetical protein